MSDVLEYAKELKTIAVKVKEFKKYIDTVGRGSFDFVVDEVVDSYISMFERFCPFDIGDRVQLKEDVDVDKCSGWISSKHFLGKGAIATVKERGYADGHFTFHIMFDDESWIDNKGIEHETVDKHTYHFSEIRLEPVDIAKSLMPKSFMGGCR